MWLAIAKLLLKIVAAIIKRRSDIEQQQIGADRVVQAQLIEIIERTKLARHIDEASVNWDDDDVDSILQRYYRNEGRDQ